MATLLVFTRTATIDKSELEIYNGKAPLTLADHPVTPLDAYGAQRILEGAEHEGMVILSFPDEAAALGWYNSPAYQEAREFRLKGAHYQVTLVEGR